jgi:hypothetical protein
MRHTSGITPCPLEGEEMTGYDPSNQDRIDSRAFRDDNVKEMQRPKSREILPAKKAGGLRMTAKNTMPA